MEDEQIFTLQVFTSIFDFPRFWFDKGIWCWWKAESIVFCCLKNIFFVFVKFHFEAAIRYLQIDFKLLAVIFFKFIQAARSFTN